MWHLLAPTPVGGSAIDSFRCDRISSFVSLSCTPWQTMLINSIFTRILSLSFLPKISRNLIWCLTGFTETKQKTISEATTLPVLSYNYTWVRLYVLVIMYETIVWCCFSFLLASPAKNILVPKKFCCC